MMIIMMMITMTVTMMTTTKQQHRVLLGTTVYHMSRNTHNHNYVSLTVEICSIMYIYRMTYSYILFIYLIIYLFLNSFIFIIKYLYYFLCQQQLPYKVSGEKKPWHRKLTVTVVSVFIWHAAGTSIKIMDFTCAQKE